MANLGDLKERYNTMGQFSGAAVYIDVSVDTISRRAIEWPKDGQPLPAKVRWKPLKLGEGTRQEHRYYVPDLDTRLE